LQHLLNTAQDSVRHSATQETLNMRYSLFYDVTQFFLSKYQGKPIGGPSSLFLGGLLDSRGRPETSLTINHLRVTSTKSEDLIYTALEA
jgi:hypothetical protein